MVRLVAGIIVLVGCACAGIIFASSFQKRVRQLDELCFVVGQMEFDIDFLNMPICGSLERISGLCEGGVKSVLDYVRRELKRDKCLNMYDLWKKAFERFENELALTDSDKKIIFDFSKNLGVGDRVREKNNIRATIMRLEAAREEARCYAATNSKMYRGLGILAGIFIVIVLL